MQSMVSYYGLHLSDGRIGSKEAGTSWKFVAMRQGAMDTSCNKGIFS